MRPALQADLNRDGWINQKDATLVLSTWGRGCPKGSVGRKPALPE